METLAGADKAVCGGFHDSNECNFWFLGCSPNWFYKVVNCKHYLNNTNNINITLTIQILLKLFSQGLKAKVSQTKWTCMFGNNGFKTLKTYIPFRQHAWGCRKPAFEVVHLCEVK